MKTKHPLLETEKQYSKFFLDVYNKLYACFGPQQWWPAQGPFEVIIGAILTQNTAWTNVEKAIAQLKKNRLLFPGALDNASVKKIARLIKPCGYYNLKAARLKNFLEVLFRDFRGSLKQMFSLNQAVLRKKLLQINGIGPETADSILLYAAEKPVFVIDAYTKRFLERHRLIKPETGYEQVQSLFQRHLPRKLSLFNEYHALIVRLGKEYCRKKPLCDLCPLKEWK